MLLIIILVIFVLAIILYSPDKASLKETVKTPIFQRIIKAKGTLLLGSLLVAIAYLSFNAAFLQIQPPYMELFGLSKQGIWTAHLFFQFVTNVFFHIDIIHLLANLSTLLLLSAYERRVGTIRFLSLFLVSGVLASLLDVLFLPNAAITLGASGGLCGLTAGYFLDYKNVSFRQWILGLIVVLVVLFVTSVVPDHSYSTYSVNWLAHLLGALCAALYIRIKRPLVSLSA